MAVNRYIGYTKDELVERLKLVNDALDRGSQTGAGIEPSVKHDFAAKKDSELRQIVKDILYALFLLAPDTYPNPETQKRMKIRTNYCR